MQRYRVNYGLLIGLFVGLFALSVLLYFLWNWQVYRKANWYRDTADIALQEGDTIKAFDYQQKFVRLRNKDDEARIKLASIAFELLQTDGVPREEQGLAFSYLSDTVRRTSDPDSRRNLADLLFQFRQPQQALVHYEELLKTSDDPELRGLRVQAMFLANDYENAIKEAYDLIGYDPEAGSFSEEKAAGANQPEVYSKLASVLIERENKQELADQIIEKMIENNPDSAMARFHNSIFLYEDDKEAAKAELEKAFQLDPENSNITARKIQVALQEEDLDLAEGLAKDAIEKFPKQTRFYLLSSSALSKNEKPDEAVAVIDKGILDFGEDRSEMLFQEKFNILLSQERIDEALEVIEAMEDLKEPRLQPLIDFQKARVTLAKKKWALASRQLRKVRTQLVGYRGKQIFAGLLLAEAYEKQGKLDQALEFYTIIEKDQAIPDANPYKRMARIKADRIRGKLDIRSGPSQVGSLSDMIKQIKKRPESQQDWEPVFDLIDKVAEKNDLSEVQILMMQAEVYLNRDMRDEAKEKIRAAAKLEPKNQAVLMAIAQILLSESDGPPKAVALLNKIEKDHGVSQRSRSLLAEATLREGVEGAAERLHAIAGGLESLTDEEKSTVLRLIATKFIALRDFEVAQDYFLQVAQLLPGDLPSRQQLFEMASQLRDDEAMQRAQEMILEVVESKQDGNYVLSEVRRRLVNFRGNSEGIRQLEEAQEMLDDALELRPRWHELHITYGQLLLLLGRDIEKALEHFEDALDYGPKNLKALTQQVKLLYQSGLYERAKERMELLPANYRTQLLGNFEADILAASGDLEAAFASAKKTAEAGSNDAKTQAWFASIAETSGNLEEAAAALTRATELNPLEQQNWIKLLGVHSKLKDKDKVAETMRAAQLALNPEIIPRLQANYFEMLNQWKNSEGIHLSLFEDDHEENATNARQLASFYLRWAAKNPDARTKAYPYINSILRNGNEGKLSSNNPHLLWAREQAAKQLTATNQYQDLKKALQLLRQGSDDGSVPQAFLPLYLQILSTRNDPISVKESISLLAPMYAQGALDKSQQLLLAKLYARSHKWDQGKDIMLDTIGRYKADEDVWNTYINLLIRQGEYSTAKGRINRFEDIAENPILISNLRASLAHEQQDEIELKKVLRSMLPPLKGARSENELKLVKTVAAMAVRYEQFKVAEQLFRFYVSRKKPDGVLELVSVLASHGDIEEALKYMDAIYSADQDAALRIVVAALRQRHGELSEPQEQQLWSYVLRALDDQPDSVQRMMVKAEGLEVMEKYDEAVVAYEEVLDSGVEARQRAIALNNLAYLLANTNQRLDESDQMIDEALFILGPLSDILDTRAVIRIAREEYDLAVEDMNLAISIDPTASKYYHLAQANALAGNQEEALKAWKSAREMKIEKEDLPLIEQQSYDSTEKLIKQIQAQQ